jgi:hypothetical protein
VSFFFFASGVCVRVCVCRASFVSSTPLVSIYCRQVVSKSALLLCSFFICYKSAAPTALLELSLPSLIRSALAYKLALVATILIESSQEKYCLWFVGVPHFY